MACLDGVSFLGWLTIPDGSHLRWFEIDQECLDIPERLLGILDATTIELEDVICLDIEFAVP